MKKITILTTIIILASGLAMGQDTIPSKCKLHIGVFAGIKTYGFQIGHSRHDMLVLYDLSSKWSIGGGFEMGGLFDFGFSKKTNDNFPLERFSCGVGCIGGFVTVSHRLNKGYLMVDAWLGAKGIGVSAYDERCEIEYEYESGPSIIHSYNIIRTDGQDWDYPLSGSIRASYQLPIVDVLSLKLTIGYDFTSFIRSDLIKGDIEITSSDWDDFETYYGQPTLNLYDSSEDIRAICSLSRFYWGISIGLYI